MTRLGLWLAHNWPLSTYVALVATIELMVVVTGA